LPANRAPLPSLARRGRPAGPVDHRRKSQLDHAAPRSPDRPRSTTSCKSRSRWKRP